MNYQFYIFHSASEYVSKKMAADIIFRKIKFDIGRDQFYILRRFIEGREIFWIVYELDKKTVCVGLENEIIEFAKELIQNPDSMDFGEKVMEAMRRQAQANPDKGFKTTVGDRQSRPPRNSPEAVLKWFAQLALKTLGIPSANLQT